MDRGRSADRYWMVVAYRKSGGVHGWERAGIAGRDAEWRRNPAVPDVWAQHHQRWSPIPRSGNAPERHACGDECKRDDAISAEFAACGVGACGQCMPGGAPEGVWMCGRCEAA